MGKCDSTPEEEVFYQRLGANIREIRMSVGLKQNHVAKWLNIVPSIYNRWEQGISHSLTPERFWLLARVTTVQPAKLLEGLSELAEAARLSRPEDKGNQYPGQNRRRLRLKDQEIMRAVA